MATHYQVKTQYSLNHGKPSIVHIAVKSTKSAVTTIPVQQVNQNSYLKIYRIFHTLKQAHLFIAYLKNVYGNIPQFILDNGQQELFTGGTK